MCTRLRTTVELIAELEAEARKFDAVFLAVGFEEGALIIFADEPDRLATLNRAVERGGEPVGLIGVQKQGNDGWQVGSRLFPEYKREHWAREFLEGFADSCGRTLPGQIPN